MILPYAAKLTPGSPGAVSCGDENRPQHCSQSATVPGRIGSLRDCWWHPALLTPSGSIAKIPSWARALRVELWAPDRLSGRGRHQRRVQRHAAHRLLDEHLQAGVGDLARESRRGQGAGARSRPNCSRCSRRRSSIRSCRTAPSTSPTPASAISTTTASIGVRTQRRIAQALPTVDYRQLKLDPRRARSAFGKPGMRIDLGGIAKGYAVDRGIEILKRRGYGRAMVNAGGDTRVIGDRFGKPWVVGIRHPDRKDEVVLRLPLEDAAFSTSGDYERYFDEGGVRYHHILDPKTGPVAARRAQCDDHRVQCDAHRWTLQDRVHPGADGGYRVHQLARGRRRSRRCGRWQGQLFERARAPEVAGQNQNDR